MALEKEIYSSLIQTGSITSDNASNNDKLMDLLATLLREYRFRGRARHVCCFAHTLNLTAKATIRQFERKKGKKKTRTDDNDDPDFDDLPLLESVIADEESDNDGNDVGEEPDDLEIPGLIDIDDNDDGEEAVRDKEEIINVFETLTVDEQEHWKAEVKPIRTALYKVSLRWCDMAITHVINFNRLVASLSRLSTPQLSFSHNGTPSSNVKRPSNSTSAHSHDSTCWNLTFDHLAAFDDLKTYVDKFTSIREHGLREFELTGEEWECIGQLVKVLQVSHGLFCCTLMLISFRS